MKKSQKFDQIKKLEIQRIFAEERIAFFHEIYKKARNAAYRKKQHATRGLEKTLIATLEQQKQLLK